MLLASIPYSKVQTEWVLTLAKKHFWNLSFSSLLLIKHLGLSWHWGSRNVGSHCKQCWCSLGWGRQCHWLAVCCRYQKLVFGWKNQQNGLQAARFGGLKEPGTSPRGPEVLQGHLPRQPLGFRSLNSALTCETSCSERIISYEGRAGRQGLVLTGALHCHPVGIHEAWTRPGQCIEPWRVLWVKHALTSFRA